MTNPKYREPVLFGGGQRNAFSPIKRALQTESKDVVGIAVGDSTANATDEFIYLWFVWLATQYPAFTFVYYPPDGSGGYGSPTTIQAGTGARTFTLYNESVASTLSNYFQGGKFSTTFPVAPDFVLWNFGKNHALTGISQAQVQGEFLGSIAQVQLAFPSAVHIFIDQYPNRDDAFMATANAAWKDIVLVSPEHSLIDMYSPAYEYTDYTDNMHMTASANSAKLLPQMQAYWRRTKVGDWTPAVPWLLTAATNFQSGDSNEKYGDFNADGTAGSVPGAVDGANPPFGWSLGGGAGCITFSKDTTIKQGSNTRSQRMIATGGTQPRISRGITANRLAALKGQWAIAVLYKYRDDGSPNTVGRSSFSVNGTGGAGTISSRLSSTFPSGGWMVECIGPLQIPNDATTVSQTLYDDTSATPDTSHGVNYQWAGIFAGKLPRSPV